MLNQTKARINIKEYESEQKDLFSILQRFSYNDLVRARDDWSKRLKSVDGYLSHQKMVVDLKSDTDPTRAKHLYKSRVERLALKGLISFCDEILDAAKVDSDLVELIFETKCNEITSRINLNDTKLEKKQLKNCFKSFNRKELEFLKTTWKKQLDSLENELELEQTKVRFAGYDKTLDETKNFYDLRTKRLALEELIADCDKFHKSNKKSLQKDNTL